MDKILKRRFNKLEAEVKDHLLHVASNQAQIIQRFEELYTDFENMNSEYDKNIKAAIAMVLKNQKQIMEIVKIVSEQQEQINILEARSNK